MKTLLMGAVSVALEVLVTFLFPLALLTAYLLGRFAVVTVLPALLLMGLAVASGLTRTLGLGLVLAATGLRALMRGIERLGAWVPAPRLGVAR